MTEEEALNALKAVSLVKDLEDRAERVADAVLEQKASAIGGWSAVYRATFSFYEDKFVVEFLPNDDSDYDRHEITCPLKYLWLSDEERKAEVSEEIDIELARIKAAEAAQKAKNEATAKEVARAKEATDRALYEKLRARFELTVLAEALDKK